MAEHPDKTRGKRRSSKWPEVRDGYLRDNPTCAVCGETEKVEVHHIISFHECPERELDPGNLLSLCESEKSGVDCHLFFGHLGNYKLINPDVLEDAKSWNTKLRKAREHERRKAEEKKAEHGPPTKPEC